jgi:DNA repair protein RadA/Sms
MAREVSRFVCQKCGFESPKWAGQCDACGEWNSLVETIVAAKPKGSRSRARSLGIKPLKLGDIKGKGVERIKVGMGELDRVLGGGMVPGSVVLLAGEPGIGKSTLLTQLALCLASLAQGKQVVYVCGEESPEQIRLRINRILKTENLKPASPAGGLKTQLFFLPVTDVDEVLVSIRNMTKKPGVVIVDSVQTMSTQDLTGMAGSVGQIRECSYRLLNMAKETAITVFLVGHVTKEGAIAGPKVLEHLVDTVLYLEGDKRHIFRILRAQKNRFGSVDEVGVFLMSDKGLTEVSNPSDVFLEERQKKVAGSCVVATMEGTRPVLVEVQGLVIPSQLAVPRRVGTGVDQRRLQLLVAVLSKRCRLPLGQMDVYVNVAGGLKLTEPAADLGVCLAIASSFKNKALSDKSVAIGEVGLLGEVRKVSFLSKRVEEAKKLGYSKIIGPEQAKNLLEAIRELK